MSPRLFSPRSSRGPRSAAYNRFHSFHRCRRHRQRGIGRREIRVLYIPVRYTLALSPASTGRNDRDWFIRPSTVIEFDLR